MTPRSNLQTHCSASVLQVISSWLAFMILLAPIVTLGCVDMGGSIKERLDNLDRSAIYGTCASACTMRLKVACVWPTAYLGFHAAHNGTTPALELWGTETMANHYPEPLRLWYLSGPAHSIEPIWITGRQAIAMGATACH